MAPPRNEKLWTDAWIVAYLEADATLTGLMNGVYSELIPQEIALPAIRFHLQGPNYDVKGVSAGRIMSRLRYLVVAVGEGESFGPLVPIADRIDELLTDAQGSNSGVNILSVERVEPWTMVEVVDGVHWRHAGGLYDFVVQSK